MPPPDQLSHNLDSHGNLWRIMQSLVRPYVLLISLASFFLGACFCVSSFLMQILIDPLIDVAFIGLGMLTLVSA